MSEKAAIEKAFEALESVGSDIADIRASIAGIHSGIADMDREIQSKLDGMNVRLEDIREFMRNAQTAASAIPILTGKVKRIEERLGMNGNGVADGTA